MLTVTRKGNEFIAKCGRGECVLPIVERTHPESGRKLVEVFSPSGVRGLFRVAVDVEYTPRRVSSEHGVITTKHVPRTTIYEHIAPLIEKMAADTFAGELTRISKLTSESKAGTELRKVMVKTLNLLYKQRWDWECTTGYEAYANSFQAVVLDGKLPQVDGKFAAEVEAQRRMVAAQALIRRGLLSSPCATGTGDPGSSYYLSCLDGYSPTELANPMVVEMPEKRRGVVNAVKNAVEITGEDPSPVTIPELMRTPRMSNAVVVCMPFASEDSVIISESLAERLTAKVRRSNWHTIDGVVNHRGGLRPTGRNGGLVKRAAEWPLSMDRNELPDGSVTCTRRMADNATPVRVVNRDAALLRELRREYESRWSGMIAKLGAYSADESRCWKEWLAKQSRWTQRHAKQKMVRRFGFGVDRVDFGDSVFCREDLGYSYRAPEVGMKLQADGDLFKGVSAILPDDKMPLVRLAGKLVRAEVICEMGASTAKHGSLRFAHSQIALYATAQYSGGVTLDRRLTAEDVAKMAVESGVYEDGSLTCDVYDCTGTVSYGRFPAGVTRVCRHRQDPSVASAVKGASVDVPWREPSSVRTGGCVTGVADTFCLLAAGLTECAKELRHDIPSSTMLRLELLRHAVA